MPDESSAPLTPGDVAEIFGVSVVTVTNWANQRKLASFRTLGGHRRFLREDVERLIAERQAEQAAS